MNVGIVAAALSTIERFIKLYPSSPAVDYALYLKGLINFNDDLGFMGKLSRQDLSERDQLAARDAFQSFKQLVEQYPESRYTADAQVRMDYISNMLAAYEVHVARYYYRRGAYVASANRAQQAIQEFQQSPSTEEALSILWLCYQKLDLDQLRDDTERVFRSNYPESELLAGDGLRVKKRPWWQVW
jgi:outer membrane protein assembly factor BamD